ncbi:MAG TPA: WXG100 family type VII secretion target [Acidimicrobiales bacterium]
MPQHLFVDPAELRASVTAVADARSALADARAALERAGQAAEGGIDHSGRADDRIRSFVRQWRSECELVAELLAAYTDVIASAAASYEDADRTAAAAIGGVGG